jgi:hypothetical protein
MPHVLMFPRKCTRKEFQMNIGYHLVHGLKFMRRYELPSLYSVTDS